MQTTERRTLKTDAMYFLEAFLKTGLAGFYTKALDRVRLLHVNTGSHQDANRVNAENLQEHLHLWG